MIASGFRLGITCCSCGGALDIDEASRAVRCPHCASILKIVRHGSVAQYFVADRLSKQEVKFHIDGHFRKHELPLPSLYRSIEQYFVPFWYVQGTVFTILKRTASDVFAKSGPEVEWYDRTEQVEVKIVDRSISLCADDSFPWSLQSLGVRPQVIQLSPVDSDFLEGYQVIPASASYEDAVKRFESSVDATARATAAPRAEMDTTAVGTTAMLIYFPVWLAEVVTLGEVSVLHFDPVAKRLAGTTPGDGMPASISKAQSANFNLQVTPHRCPNCGADLPDKSGSETFYCSNCRRLLLDCGDRYETLRLVVPINLDPSHLLFPFWAFDLSSLSGESIETYRKLERVVGFHSNGYMVPAFRVANPTKLMRLIQHYNRGIHDIKFQEYPNDQYQFVDVELNPGEASDMIMPLTIACAASRGFKIAGLNTEKLHVQSRPRLLWLPFLPDRYFWREAITGAAIERAAVKV